VLFQSVLTATNFIADSGLMCVAVLYDSLFSEKSQYKNNILY